VHSYLSDPSILPLGQPSSSGVFNVYNPADPTSSIATLPVQGVSETKEAIAKSKEALQSWRDGTTGMYRAQRLRQWSTLIQEHEEDISKIMTLESGKPLSESRGEVAYGRSFVDYFAGEATRPGGAGGGSIIPSTLSMDDGRPKGQMMTINQAVGCTAMVTPWNFPLAMITRKASPALAAGCTVIVKPSELTPLTALVSQELAYRAGIPEDVFQIITSDQKTTPSVGKELCSNPTISKISFTGSTAVGKQLMEWSSPCVKRLSLELGGNAPFIVFNDADLDQAVDAAMASKFRNAGQTCVCADRFLIHEDIHDRFVDKLRERIGNSLISGDGMDDRTTLGPLITENAAIKVKNKVDAAVASGTKLVCGGVRHGTHVEPTVLTDVPLDSDIWKTETFGPVVAIRSFSSDAEAVLMSNDSPYGLAAYFCTSNLARSFRVAQMLECGLVGLNEGIIATCAAPFGGVKESGLGREGGTLGIGEFLETKYIFMNT